MNRTVFDFLGSGGFQNIEINRLEDGNGAETVRMLVVKVKITNGN